ncbi:MAG: hypothetical protein AB9882_14095 [Ignavibacteriaceae bacterium]
MLNKKISVILLFSVALFLILANVLIPTNNEEPGKSADSINSGTSLTGAEIESHFLDVLREFDVDTLLTKGKSSKKNHYSAKLKVPSDLPVPLILKELYNRFEKSDVVVNARDTLRKNPLDQKNVQITILRLRGKTSGTFEIVFENDEKLIRKKGELGFYINNINEIDKTEFDYLLTYPENLGFELLPTKESKDKKEVIKRNRKESGVVISDEISDIDFKVHSKYSKNRLLMSVKLLIGAFPENNYFLIDKDAEIYNSIAFAYMESEFNKRNYKIIPTYKFDYLDGESAELVLHKFKTMTTKTLEGDNVILSISYDNFMVIQDAIRGLKKKGVHIVPPSKIIAAE